MPIQIEIKEAYIKHLISFYASKQKEIRDQISSLDRELKELSATINQLRQGQNYNIQNGNNVPLLDENDVYSVKWPWAKKIAFAIKEAGKAITVKEIVDILNIYEPRNEEEKKTAISSISSTLSQKSGKADEGKEFVKEMSASGELAYLNWDEAANPESKAKQSYGSKATLTQDDLPF